MGTCTLASRVWSQSLSADAVHSDARHPAGAGGLEAGVHAWQPNHYSRKPIHYMLQYVTNPWYINMFDIAAQIVLHVRSPTTMMVTRPDSCTTFRTGIH